MRLALKFPRLWLALLSLALTAACSPAGPPPAATTPALPVTSTAALLPPTAIPSPTLVPENPLAVSPQAAASSPLFPGLDLILNVRLPDEAGEIDLYRLAAPADTDEAALREMAAKLGIEGSLYVGRDGIPTGSGGPGSFRPSDLRDDVFLLLQNGRRIFFYGSAQTFEYQTGAPVLFPPASCTPPCLPAGTSAVQETLAKAGLLPPTFKAEASGTQPHVENLIQYLGDYAVIYPPGSGAQVMGRGDPDGKLLWLRYQPAAVVEEGSARLRSAQEAWQALLNDTTNSGVLFHEYAQGLSGADGVSLPQTWTRRYAAGRDLTIFGYAQTYRLVSGNGEALILLNGYPLTVKTQGLAEAAAGGRLIQAWGRVDNKAEGSPLLALDGWQVSVFPEQAIEGTLARQGEKAELVTPQSRYSLVDAPADLPDGASLTVYGVLPEEPELTLEWYAIHAGPLETVRTGGPGFISSGSGLIPSGRLDGLQGTPEVIVHAFSDGSAQVAVEFTLEAGAEGAPGARVRLDGPGLRGIEAYHRLPVRIWGEVTDVSGGLPVVTVERFEPEYPDLAIEAWLGLVEPVEMDGQTVWRLTTPDDEQYMIEAGGDAALSLESLSYPWIVEGIRLPEQTIGGLPVIRAYTWFSGIGRMDLDGYEIASAQPRVMNEPGTAGARRRAVIETVELVYYVPQGSAPGDLLQPVWRFAGHFEDGAYFEILVQAASL